MANPMGKTRPKTDPDLIYERAGWTWRVLKAWQTDPHKPYARWFCDVTSPFTGAGDLGDTYIADVVKYGALTYRDLIVPDSMIPEWEKVPQVTGW
jgi:hypothetical protein